ncbi:hypothetical protein AArcMg_2881 [Natrarchaeobaculum sulfurireducens]|uniref:Uncharacterized protein n=1 Tax=Natrarchaeobaculum sulfurireducens TaxID=2044521 RepID=A0A346PCB8_9EURY|nr:hypothetical protein AArc1_0821 [Natrarchaeobaculum sulfurireducens]AXR82870.1 hypothetical protein AArcMg_2881 [Natrarchaeobaculum sulfurireducens]
MWHGKQRLLHLLPELSWVASLEAEGVTRRRAGPIGGTSQFVLASDGWVRTTNGTDDEQQKGDD